MWIDDICVTTNFTDFEQGTKRKFYNLFFDYVGEYGQTIYIDFTQSSIDHLKDYLKKQKNIFGIIRISADRTEITFDISKSTYDFVSECQKLENIPEEVAYFIERFFSANTYEKNVKIEN